MLGYGFEKKPPPEHPEKWSPPWAIAAVAIRKGHNWKGFTISSITSAGLVKDRFATGSPFPFLSLLWGPAGCNEPASHHPPWEAQWLGFLRCSAHNKVFKQLFSGVFSWTLTNSPGSSPKPSLHAKPQPGTFPAALYRVVATLNASLCLSFISLYHYVDVINMQRSSRHQPCPLFETLYHVLPTWYYHMIIYMPEK